MTKTTTCTYLISRMGSASWCCSVSTPECGTVTVTAFTKWGAFYKAKREVKNRIRNRLSREEGIFELEVPE